jgi:excisionase family DNA binding protein
MGEKKHKQGGAPHPEAQEVFSASQAAVFLGVTRQTVYRYFADGKLPGFRLAGNDLRFRRSDLLALLEPLPVPRAVGEQQEGDNNERDSQQPDDTDK